DTRLDGYFQYFLQSYPITSVLIRSFNSPSHVTSNSYTYNGSFSHLYSWGGSLKVEFDNSRLRTDEAFSTLGLQYRTKAGISFTMPLMRNFRINDEERRTRSLRRMLDNSDLAFRQKLVDLIARTQAAYYDLVFAIENEKILRQSVELAVAQLQLNEQQVA